MRICFFDFEATGLDTNTARILEYAYIIYEVDHKRVSLMSSSLMRDDTYLPIEKEAADITGIKNSMFLDKSSDILHTTPRQGLESIRSAFTYADFICAHNGAEYDMPLLKAELARNNLQPIPDNAKLIDTMTDLPKEYGTKKLTYLAAELGIVAPIAHHALFDCLTLMQVFLRHDLDEILLLARSPAIKIQAKVPYDHRERASKNGYRWVPETKAWVKKIKVVNLQAEKQKLAPFDVETIG